MKYTAKPIEVEAFVITGIGQVHADGTFNVEIDTGELIKNDDGVEVTEHEILVAPALPVPAIGDYYITNMEGNAVNCVKKKPDFEAHYASEATAPVSTSEPTSAPAPTLPPVATPVPTGAPEPTGMPA